MQRILIQGSDNLEGFDTVVSDIINEILDKRVCSDKVTILATSTQGVDKAVKEACEERGANCKVIVGNNLNANSEVLDLATSMHIININNDSDAYDYYREITSNRRIDCECLYISKSKN